jgi:WD40 repeat protein
LPTRQPPQGRRFGDILERRLKSPEINLPQRILHEHNGTVNGLAFDPRGRFLATAGADGTVAVRNTLTGDLLWQQTDVDSNGLFSLAFAPDGKSVATGGADGRLRIWDAATGKELRILKAHTDKVTALAFHPAGKLLASGGFDRRFDSRISIRVRSAQPTCVMTVVSPP